MILYLNANDAYRVCRFGRQRELWGVKRSICCGGRGSLGGAEVEVGVEEEGDGVIGDRDVDEEPMRSGCMVTGGCGERGDG